jgi:pre-rRNA-processing protein TSR1
MGVQIGGIADMLCPSTPLLVYGLLAHEQKISVLNMVIKRHVSAAKFVVPSKTRLIFHVGCRRFAASALFSQHTNMDKHKMERYLPGVESTCVVSIYAPITYPPSSVLVFIEDSKVCIMSTRTLIMSCRVGIVCSPPVPCTVSIRTVCASSA